MTAFEILEVLLTIFLVIAVFVIEGDLEEIREMVKLTYVELMKNRAKDGEQK